MTAGKGSTRRICLISREEEDLRWRLIQGEITLARFYAVKKRIESRKLRVPCSQCIDGLLVGENYSVICRLDDSKKLRSDSCYLAVEDK